jgi:acyl carrier protein
MTDSELFARLVTIAQRVFDISIFDRESSMINTPSWDSLRHVHLLSALEREFGIEVGPDDAFRLTSASRLVEFLRVRLHAAQ